MNSSQKSIFEDHKINIKFRLSGLWIAATLCYIYGDIVAFYQPGALAGIMAGKMGPLGPTTQELLLGVSVFMSIPCIMVFLSLVLKPGISRWLNMIMGIINTVVMILTMLMGPWAFYLFFGVVEVALTTMIILYAWKWPKMRIH